MVAKIDLRKFMKNLHKLFCVLVASVALWPRAAAAQTRIGTPPSSYVWRNVTMGGGGFVTGIIFHPNAKNLRYARTDVGGAYRWDDTAQKWIPITDWLGAADNNLMGIESIGLDPSDPKRVYLAAGTYSRGDAAILRSDDQGKTFQRTDVSFKMGGNETGRFNGERLAVDPNDGKILFFGSRAAGLWKSGDRAVTWQKVGSFPNVSLVQTPPPVSNTTTNARPRLRRGFGQQQSVGIVSVVFDSASGKPGSATPKIFAAVSSTETNLFFSADAGATWQAVTNQPIGLRPNHLILSPDEMLYLTYGREPGPNSMSDGAVWKFDPKAHAWTNITPLKPSDAGQPFGYGAVTVDAQHPSTIMVTTFAHWRPHDFIFRSTDGGAHWSQLWQDDTEWDHSSAPYISGVGDIDGFVHDDLNVSPAKGTFAGPRYGNTEDLAFAGKNSLVIVRAGTVGNQDVRAAFSRDGGATWQELETEPPTGNGAGAITISADAQTLVWTPRGGEPYFTKSWGTNWTACAGLSTGMRVVADAVNPQKFYAFDSRSGRFYASTNGAASFTATAEVFAAQDNNGFGSGGGATMTATPGIEN